MPISGPSTARRTVGSGPTAVTTLYVAGMEIKLHGSTEDHRTVYYAAGGAFRVIGGSDAGLYFRLTDHLWRVGDILSLPLLPEGGAC